MDLPKYGTVETTEGKRFAGELSFVYSLGEGCVKVKMAKGAAIVPKSRIKSVTKDEPPEDGRNPQGISHEQRRSSHG